MAPELEKQLANLNPGEHLCPIYENAAERLAVVIPFIKHGLARRERCLFVADDRTTEEVIQALSAAGIDVASERGHGALRFLNKSESFLLGASSTRTSCSDSCAGRRGRRSPTATPACGSPEK